MKNKLKTITFAALTAALYVALTCLCSALGLASGAIQLRFSEALAALCLFTPAAIPGLFVGCLISNFVTGCIPWDVALGSLATLIGSLGAYLLRKKPIPALFMPVIANTLIIPPVLKWAYGFDGALWYFAATVFAGELISCVVFGFALYKAIKKAGPVRMFFKK